ncbi:DNA-processing protein DprA [Rheinheimera sp. MMS21-TC3]|uniref:DNA-processing protein DprA n=1 Tax=Rheinheimera sp. MMS21-TC3 TaxID=3072790 RepID=UPI0028C460F4|nr:DNA-processing protein DprA [Rheinheimera sp. MMS21-TC3]WNO59705.1 DNA-processing protein DprA [Rheinheimera sp. MMS21-TC3]
MKDLRNWLALATVHGLDGLKFQRLSEHISAAELVSLPISALQNLGFTSRQAQLLASESASKVDSALAWYEQSECHHIITFFDPNYPALLKQIKNPPLVLFIKGHPSVLSQQQFAMVGSRQPTPAGRKIAQTFAGELSQQGYIITSGMARGIDSESHKGALQASGITIAVLGHGLEQIYPASNKSLAATISEQGALVSEYFPQVAPLASYFPQRNRIVVGLSIGTIVVEAAVKSGSLISANLAAENNRDVFAVPGNIYNPQSTGCHLLIQQGAKLVTNVADILEERSFLTNSCTKSEQAVVKKANIDLFAAQLLANVGDDVTTIDIIAERSGMAISEANVALLELELAGEVATVPGGYIRVRST